MSRVWKVSNTVASIDLSTLVYTKEDEEEYKKFLDKDIAEREKREKEESERRKKKLTESEEESEGESVHFPEVFVGSTVLSRARANGQLDKLPIVTKKEEEETRTARASAFIGGGRRVVKITRITGSAKRK